MKIWLRAVVVLLALGGLAAGDFSEAERQSLLGELKETRARLLDELEGLSEEQARYQSAEDRWAVIHALEHIVLAEEALQGVIVGMLEGEPAPKTPTDASDQKVAEFVVDRSQKFNAPERVQPTGRYQSLQEGIEAFEAVRKRSIELISKTEQDLRAYRAGNPVLGTLDGVQWAKFLSGHSARHTLQIREIKASDGFPGS